MTDYGVVSSGRVIEVFMKRGGTTLDSYSWFLLGVATIIAFWLILLAPRQSRIEQRTDAEWEEVYRTRQINAEANAKSFADSAKGSFISCLYSECTIEKEGSLYPLRCEVEQDGNCTIEVQGE